MSSRGTKRSGGDKDKGKTESRRRRNDTSGMDDRELYVDGDGDGKENNEDSKATRGKRSQRGKGARMQDGNDENNNTDDQSTPDLEHMKLLDAVDSLTDKKPATRISSLTLLKNDLTKAYIPDFIEERILTISTNVLNAIKKGKDDEVELACQVLMLACITVGSSGVELEQIYAAAEPSLSIITKDPSGSPKTRMAVTEALGMLTFLNRDEQAALATMKDLKGAMTALKAHKGEDEMELLAQMAISWALIATLLSAITLGGSIYQEDMPLFVYLAEHSSLSVRIAAGESMAMMCEAQDIALADPAYDSGAKKRLSVVTRETLIELASSLATDASKSKAKKERVVQKASYRNVLATIEDGSRPVEAIKVGNVKYDLEGWDKLKQLAALRNVLASGLPYHLVENSFLCDILEVGGDEDDAAMDVGDFREMGKMNSRVNKKNAYAMENKARNNKAAFMLHGGMEDD